MTLDPVPVGPTRLGQLTPVTPVTDKMPLPVGVSPLEGPETVAVNLKVEPSVVDGVLVVIVMLGIRRAIVSEVGVITPNNAEL